VHLPADPTAAREAMDLLDPGLLMHASDHPHDHGPGASRLRAALTAPETDAVFGATAAGWTALAKAFTTFCE
jgi:hypothetical protein